MKYSNSKAWYVMLMPVYKGIKYHHCYNLLFHLQGTLCNSGPLFLESEFTPRTQRLVSSKWLILKPKFTEPTFTACSLILKLPEHTEYCLRSGLSILKHRISTFITTWDNDLIQSFCGGGSLPTCCPRALSLCLLESAGMSWKSELPIFQRCFINEGEMARGSYPPLSYYH